MCENQNETQENHETCNNSRKITKIKWSALQADTSSCFFSLSAKDKDAVRNFTNYIKRNADSAFLEFLEIEDLKLKHGKYGLIRISFPNDPIKFVLIGHVVCALCFSQGDGQKVVKYDIFTKQGMNIRKKSKILENSVYLANDDFCERLVDFPAENPSPEPTESPLSPTIFSTPFSTPSATTPTFQPPSTPTPSQTSRSITPTASSDATVNPDFKLREAGGTFSNHFKQVHNIVPEPEPEIHETQIQEKSKFMEKCERLLFFVFIFTYFCFYPPNQT